MIPPCSLPCCAACAVRLQAVHLCCELDSAGGDACAAPGGLVQVYSGHGRGHRSAPSVQAHRHTEHGCCMGKDCASHAVRCSCCTCIPAPAPNFLHPGAACAGRAGRAPVSAPSAIMPHLHCWWPPLHRTANSAGPARVPCTCCLGPLGRPALAWKLSAMQPACVHAWAPRCVGCLSTLWHALGS